MTLHKRTVLHPYQSTRLRSPYAVHTHIHSSCLSEMQLGTSAIRFPIHWQNSAINSPSPCDITPKHQSTHMAVMHKHVAKLPTPDISTLHHRDLLSNPRHFLGRGRNHFHKATGCPLHASASLPDACGGNGTLVVGAIDLGRASTT